MASRLTLLYGPSGVGKSSVLNAGVAHHLRARPGAKPRRGKPEFAHRHLPDVARRSARRPRTRDRDARSDAPPTGTRSPIGCVNATEADRRRPADHPRSVRGVLPLPRTDGRRRARSRSSSRARSTGRDLRVSFLVSMREDSIAKLDFFKGRIPNLFDNYLRIDHLEREPGARRDRQAHRAVQPARCAPGDTADEDRSGAGRRGARTR